MHELGASEMTAHALLLTGVPGVGKTTIVSKVAAGLSGRRNRGFVTDEIREGERRVGFEIRTFGGKTRTRKVRLIGRPLMRPLDCRN